MGKKTTALLLGALAVPPIAEVIAASNKKDSSALALGECRDVATPSLPSSSIYASEMTTTAYADLGPEEIKTFINGQLRYCDAITTRIQDIKTHDPHIADYVDFVFKYLKDFLIIVSSKAEIEKEKTQKYDAGFSSRTNKMLVRGDINQNSIQEHRMETYSELSELRHEFRHGLWKTLRSIHSPNSTSAECFLPNTEVNNAKIEEWLKLGDQRVDELRDLLNQESKGELAPDSENANLLKQLRNETTVIYREKYSIRTPASFEKSIHSNLEVGKIYNRDKELHVSLGVFKVLSKEEIKVGTKSGWSYFIELLDPLHGLCEVVAHHQKMVPERYPVHARPLEREAYLFGSIPIPLIEYFYSEIYKHGVKTLQQAQLANPPRFRSSRSRILTPYDYWYDGCRKIMTDPAIFTVEDISEILHHAKYFYYKKENLDLAKQGLKMLIDKGHEKPIANLLLARIAVTENHSNNATRYYKRAFKLNANLEYADYFDYSTCLIREKSFKEAEKMYKIAVKMLDAAIAAEKNPQISAQLRAYKQATADAWAASQRSYGPSFKR